MNLSTVPSFLNGLRIHDNAVSTVPPDEASARVAIAEKVIFLLNILYAMVVITAVEYKFAGRLWATTTTGKQHVDAPHRGHENGATGSNRTGM